MLSANLLHSGDLRVATLIINGFGLSSLHVLGFLTNLFSLKVLKILANEPTTRGCQSYNVLLSGILCIDILLNVSSIFICILPTFLEYFEIGGRVIVFLIKIYYPYLYAVSWIGDIAQTASTGLLLWTTHEKLKNSSDPFWAISFCTKKRGYLITGGVILASILFNLPRWFEFDTKWNEEEQNGNTSIIVDIMIRQTTLRQNPDYMSIYWTWISLAINYIIPILILIPLNYLITVQIIKFNNGNGSGAYTRVKSKSENISVFHSTLGFTILFFICSLLEMLLINGHGGTINMSLKSLSIISLVSNVFVSLNSSLKFFICYVCGERFREVSRELLTSH